jgi:hypothetical protein
MCRAAGVDPKKWARWRGKNDRQKLSRDEYLRLCPWLSSRYGYSPPTNEYQFL